MVLGQLAVRVHELVDIWGGAGVFAYRIVLGGGLQHISLLLREPKNVKQSAGAPALLREPKNVAPALKKGGGGGTRHIFSQNFFSEFFHCGVGVLSSWLTAELTSKTKNHRGLICTLLLDLNGWIHKINYHYIWNNQNVVSSEMHFVAHGRRRRFTLLTYTYMYINSESQDNNNLLRVYTVLFGGKLSTKFGLNLKKNIWQVLANCFQIILLIWLI